MFNNNTPFEDYSKPLDLKPTRKKPFVKRRQTPVKPLRPVAIETEPVPISEHFENFTDTVTDITANAVNMFTDVADTIVEPVQNFLGLAAAGAGLLRGGKGARKRRAARQEVKNQKKLAKADVIQSKADANRIQAQGAADAKIIEANALAAAAAAQQAAQVNQLQSQVQPQAAPVQYQDVPQYQEVSQSRQMQTDDTAEERPTVKTGQIPPTKSKKTLYIIIAIVAVVAIYFFIKKKK